MTSDKLSNAVQLIKSGNKQAALPILKEIIQANPRDENAWLWLYSCVEQIELKKVCLQKALEINPNNQQAHNALRKLSDLASQPVQQADRVKTTPPQPAPKSKASGGKRSNRPWFFALGTGSLILLCMVSFFYLVRSGQISALAANLPLFPPATMTPSLTPTATATSTITPSPSPTLRPTATLTPTLTPTEIILSVPEILSISTPTIEPSKFKYGDPTATPLGSEITDPNFKKGVAAFYKTFNDRVDNYEPVVKLMSAAIAANPDLAPPYQYRGVAYWYLGDCVAGMADEEKALSINPNHAVAWADHGLLNDCLGNETGMLQDYQRALSLDPSLAWVHFNLGVYYYGKGNYEKSLDEYSLSVEIDPKDSRGWGGKSEALARLGYFDECITNASKALQVYNKEWLAYSDRGYCEYIQGKYTDAIKDYKIYVDKIQDNPSAYCYLSYSYFETKQYRNSLDAAKRSIAIDPECGGRKLVEVEARSSYALGDYDQGIEYMNQALSMGAYPLGYYYRGIIYQAAKRKAEAIQDLKQFLATGYTGEEVADAQARLAKLAP